MQKPGRDEELDDSLRGGLASQALPAALAQLRQEKSASVTEAFNCVRRVLDVSVAESKALVGASQVWAAEVAASERVHNDMCDALEEMAAMEKREK